MGNHGTRKGNGKDGPVKMSRKNCNERKREKRMILCVLFFFFLGLVPQIAENVRTSEDLQPAIARKVLRFHVLANMRRSGGGYYNVTVFHRLISFFVWHNI